VSSSSAEAGVRARLRSLALRLLFVGGLTVLGWLAGSAVASASPLGSLTGGSLLGASPEGAPAVTVGSGHVSYGGADWCGGLVGGLTAPVLSAVDGDPTGTSTPSPGGPISIDPISAGPVSVGPVAGSAGGSDDRSAADGIAGTGVWVGTPRSDPAALPSGRASARTAGPHAPPAPVVRPPAAAPAAPPAEGLTASARSGALFPVRHAPRPRAPVAAPRHAGTDAVPTLPPPDPAPPAAPAVPSASIGGHDLGGGLRGYHAVLVPQPHVAAATAAGIIRDSGTPANGHDSGLPSITPD
jgi:hypothetical protein